jgi:uncharacterized membrane protein YgaE (UPF0421/DUF939 family)
MKHIVRGALIGGLSFFLICCFLYFSMVSTFTSSIATGPGEIEVTYELTPLFVSFLIGAVIGGAIGAIINYFKSKNEKALDINKERVTDKSEKLQEPVSAIAESTDTEGIKEISKYKVLLDEGIITQEEFDTKKKELIGDWIQ